MYTVGALKLITPPAVEPLTLAEAKAFLRVDTGITVDDTLLTSLIVAARRHVENITGRALITQTWECYFDTFPYSDYWALSRPLGVWPYAREALPPTTWASIQVPKAPLQTVNSLKYYDPAGALQTLAGSAYVVDAVTEPARVTPVYGTYWPVTQTVPNAVILNFKAGFGDAAANIPEDLVNAIKMVIGALYQQREVLSDAPAPRLSLAFDYLINPYRMSFV